MRQFLTLALTLGVMVAVVGQRLIVPSYNSSTNFALSRSDRVYKAKYMAKYGAMVKKMQFESIGVPDFRVGALVSRMKPGFGFNADEMGSYMEADILMPRRRGPVKRQISTFRWPGGIVYYRVNGRFNSQQRSVIRAAMDQFHKRTCVKFRPWTGRSPHFVSIENKKTGCWSALGRVGGKQRLNLQTPGCTYTLGVPIHEFMHVLGIFHEHVRTDRDDYVKIGWRNIEPGKEHNFERRSYSGLGEVYDYGSVMHYSSRVFSRNNLPTIIPKLDTGSLIGQRNGFSDSDIAKINRLYDCFEKSNLLSNELSIPDYSDFSKFIFPTIFPQDDISNEGEHLNSIRTSIEQFEQAKRRKRPPKTTRRPPSRNQATHSVPGGPPKAPRRPPKVPGRPTPLQLPDKLKTSPYCRYGALCGDGFWGHPPWLTKYIVSYHK